MTVYLRMVYVQEVKETGPRDKPQKRWRGSTEKNIQENGVTSWIEKIGRGSKGDKLYLP